MVLSFINDISENHRYWLATILDTPNEQTKVVPANIVAEAVLGKNHPYLIKISLCRSPTQSLLSWLSLYGSERERSIKNLHEVAKKLEFDGSNQLVSALEEIRRSLFDSDDEDPIVEPTEVVTKTDPAPPVPQPAPIVHLNSNYSLNNNWNSSSSNVFQSKSLQNTQIPTPIRHSDSFGGTGTYYYHSQPEPKRHCTAPTKPQTFPANARNLTLFDLDENHIHMLCSILNKSDAIIVKISQKYGLVFDQIAPRRYSNPGENLINKLKTYASLEMRTIECFAGIAKELGSFGLQDQLIEIAQDIVSPKFPKF